MTHTIFRMAGTLAAAAALLSTAAFAGPLEDANKKLVLEFHAVVLNGKDADAAPKYVADNYIQHNPRVPDGLAALQGFVREMKRGTPESRANIKRVVAEGDLVVIHSHVQRTPGERGAALVDIFRVQDGKIVEHWDIVQPIPETSANSNGMT
ncbi:MAG: polyketide cyclase [Ramlibacter sp.]|nr:polyketide cyclase [Ramlibacter sp.]